jgi:hypothetical protein
MPELLRFLAYLTSGHEDEDGRCGNAGKCNSLRKSVRLSIIHTC